MTGVNRPILGEIKLWKSEIGPGENWKSIWSVSDSIKIKLKAVLKIMYCRDKPREIPCQE